MVFTSVAIRCARTRLRLGLPTWKLVQRLRLISLARWRSISRFSSDMVGRVVFVPHWEINLPSETERRKTTNKTANAGWVAVK